MTQPHPPQSPPPRSGPARATLAAATPFQTDRGRKRGRILLATTDLRRAERRGKEGNLVLFVVDASGSMTRPPALT